MNSEPDKMFEDLKKSLQMLPYQRTNKQLNFIKSYMNSLEFFKKSIISTSEDLFIKTCECMSYEFYNAKDFVCRYEESGNKFYVILDGIVSVIVKNALDNEDYETCKLSKGMSFGEYSILHNQPRLASIQCVTGTHLAVLTKENYLAILGKIECKKLDDLVKFLRKFQVFRNWSRSPIIKVSYFLKEKSYMRKSVVFHEGDIIENLYFVKSGELEIIKNLKTKKPTKNLYFRELSPSQDANIAIIGPGELVGEEFLSCDRYPYTCKVYSYTATLLCMSKQDFLQRVKTEDSQISTTNQTEAKEITRNLRIKSLKYLRSFPTQDLPIEPHDISEKPNTYFKSFIPNRISVTPTKKSAFKYLQDSDIRQILLKSRIDIASPLQVQHKYKKHILSSKSSERRYIYPLKIEQKKIYNRDGVFRDQVRLQNNMFF